ncbi:hypothetical protein ACFOGI_00765 [Virgibacillus xinjiangensis]|uniref:Uncharacterized protein n=1 Tax=Virgibacillus xinjiangensis TaxID=393090 RepID=A0ABV7CR66_9BACI
MTKKKVQGMYTANVSVRRKGRIYEDELAVGQKFRKHYEETNFEAEVFGIQTVTDLKAQGGLIFRTSRKRSIISSIPTRNTKTTI